MKIPNNELYMNKQSSSEKYDSDITIVTDSQEKQHKKKHKFITENSEGNSQKQLSVEASQSLLQPKKKKKLPSPNKNFPNEQSQSMPSENIHTLFTDVITDDDSESCSMTFKQLKKKKKRRDTISENLFADGNVSPPKKRKNNIDLFSQDIFKQPSSEDFVFSTPKKAKRETNYENDGRNNVWSPVGKTENNNHKKIKGSNDSENDSDTNERIKVVKQIDLTMSTPIKKNKKKWDISYSISSETSPVSLKNGNSMSNGTAKLEVKNESNEMKKHKRKASQSINKTVDSNKENSDSKTILDKYLERISVVDGNVIPLKKRKKQIDLFSQDIFKQPSSEDFVFSTPKKETNHENDGKNNVWSPVRKIDDNNHKPQQNSSEDIISSTPEKKKGKKIKQSNDSDTNERIKVVKQIDLTDITPIKKNKKKRDINHSISSETSPVSLKNGNSMSNGTAKLEVQNESNGMKKHKRKASQSINKTVDSNKETSDSKTILDTYLESISFVDDWDNTKLTHNSSEIIDLESDNQNNKKNNFAMLKSNRTKKDKKQRELTNGSNNSKHDFSPSFSPEISVDKNLFSVNKKDKNGGFEALNESFSRKNKKKIEHRESVNGSYSTKENGFCPESSLDKNLSSHNSKESISIDLTGTLKSTETSVQPGTFVKNQKKRKHINSSSEESIQPQTSVKNEKKKGKHRDPSSKESVHPHNFIKKEKIRKRRDSSSEDRISVLDLLDQHLDLTNDSFHDKYIESDDNDLNNSRHDRLHVASDGMIFLSEDSSILSDPGKKKKKKPNKLLDNAEFKMENGSRLEASKTANATIYSSSDSDCEYENLRSVNKLEIQRASLKSLDIVVNFQVPRLHEICNRASIPTAQQRMKLAEENISIKTGKFVIAEDKQIKENWQLFLKLYNFDDMPELFISLDKQYISTVQKQNFLFFLAQNLPDRTPYAVYLRFKNLMITKKKGRFTEEEDEYILKQMEETGCQRNYMVEIAHHLQRTFHSVEKRIQKLKDKHTRKIRWKREENLASFIKYLLKVTGIRPEEIDKLKNRHISSGEWRKLSKKLDNVPIRILKRAWLEPIHTKLFIPGKCFDLREAKIKLVQMFYENNERDWRAVDWNKYATHFDGLTPLRIYSLLKNLVIKRVPKEKQHNLRKCIKALKNCTTADLAQHVIYKVKYKDGKIEDYGKKENKS